MENKQEKITSEKILSLYIKSEDEEVFKLTDVPGINILRKYKSGTRPAKSNRRMFIKFHARQSGEVSGGIDMVKVPVDMGGYPIVFEDEKGFKNIFRSKFPNFFFGPEEGVIFNRNTKNISFKEKTFTINELIDLIEKKHTEVFDMFWKSRLSIFLKNYFILEPLFWLADGDYSRDRINFLLNRERTDYTKKEARIEPTKEPFFKYFDIYKNTLLFFVLAILTPIFLLSISLSNFYFTITNPFWLFSAFLVFSILDRFSKFLLVNIKQKKESFVYKIAESTLNMKGHLNIR